MRVCARETPRCRGSEFLGEKMENVNDCDGGFFCISPRNPVSASERQSLPLSIIEHKENTVLSETSALPGCS